MANFLTARDLTLDNLLVRKRAIIANLTITDGSKGNITLLPGVTPIGVTMTETALFNTYPPESPIYSTEANTAAPIKTDGLLNPDALRLRPLAATNGCAAFPGILLPAVNARYGPISTPSLIQAPSLCLFVSGDLSTAGSSTLTTIAFKKDTNFTSTTWKLKIKPGGAWQAPFHAHFGDEQWVITAGSWIWRYFDRSLFDSGGAFTKFLLPGETPGLNTGPPILLDPLGRPSGPNTKLTASVGDVVIFKKGSFFEWGSDVSNASLVATWNSGALSNAINTAETALIALLDSTITLCQFEQYLAMFQSDYDTPFDDCPL